MDIGLLSIALHQGKAQQQASMSVMKKALESAEQHGDVLNKMLSEVDVKTVQQAAQPHVGSIIDIKL